MKIITIFLFVFYFVLPFYSFAQNTNTSFASFGRLSSNPKIQETGSTIDSFSQKELQQIERIFFTENNTIRKDCKLDNAFVFYQPRRGEAREGIIVTDSLKKSEYYMAIIRNASYGSRIYIDNIYYSCGDKHYKISNGFRIFINKTYNPEAEKLLKEGTYIK